MTTRIAGATQATPATPSPQASGSPEREWPAYAHDAGGSRHSPLTSVHRDNVSRLQPAWTYRTGEIETYAGTEFAVDAAFQATPLMVDGTLFLSTASCRVIALDAATGVERWVYDPEIDLSQSYSNATSRGVATWTDPSGRRLIYIGTLDGRLIALDAASGLPVPEFGTDGQIDLSAGVGVMAPGEYQVTSPPAVLGDSLIVGSSVGDNSAVEAPRGIVRAFDTRTGTLRWSWDPIPRQPGDAGYDTWQGELAHRTGAANAWAPISVDPDRDLVFVPTSSPSPDFFGGERLGENAFANSVVALRGSTGEVVWSFQTVHHDLWDYDVPMQPCLITLERDGGTIPAVAVGTKTGFLFVLDRESGAPLFPIEERAVPQTDVAGEQSWPSQPFPTQLPVFGLRDVTPDDAWGPTPEAQQSARDQIAAMRWEGPFTPVGLTTTIQAPGYLGGFNWSGLTYDPILGLLIRTTNRIASVTRLIPREELAGIEATPRVPSNSDVGEQEGTPFAIERGFLFDAQTLLPMTAPPWGTLVAVDLNQGTLAWEIPLGVMLDQAQFPDAPTWGSINLGGPTSTAGGITFVAGSLDGTLRAFDTASGANLWEATLPTGGHAAPMTYETDGRQFVVIAAGGHGRLGTQPGDAVVAFALPAVS